MRHLLLAVIALSACQTVDDTCDAGDVDCWLAHLEVSSAGLTVERFPGRAINGGGGMAPTGAVSTRALLWAVGTSGTILAADQRGWTAQDSGTAVTLRSAWAAALNDVWAGGEGELLHFDGVQWKQVATGLDVVTGISGSAADDVWFAAGTGGLLHFDGAGFSSIATGLSEPTASVWVPTRGEVWAGGARGALAHLRDGQWRRETSTVTAPIAAIHGPSSAEVFLAAGSLLHGGDGGFAPVTPNLGLAAVHANGGLVWAVASAGTLVHGPPFATQQVSSRPNAVFFDGALAFLVGPAGAIEAYGTDGALLGATAPVSTPVLYAITGVERTPAPKFTPKLTWDGDASVRLAPGAAGTIPIGFDDPCGATPGVCIQLCSRSSRCSSGIICTQQKRDDLVKGHLTLGVRYSAAPSAALEDLDLVIGALDCGCSGCTSQLASDGGITFGGSVRVPVALEPLPAKKPPSGAGGGGGGGASTCDHCVTGGQCSACGSGTACGGKTCCSPGETCSGVSCRTSSSSGHSLTTVQECGATPRYTVQCGGGGCCPTCMTCNSDGTCSLP
jgi:hypothetical protein